VGENPTIFFAADIHPGLVVSLWNVYPKFNSRIVGQSEGIVIEFFAAFIVGPAVRTGVVVAVHRCFLNSRHCNW
jgi:hypothetical protein